MRKLRYGLLGTAGALALAIALPAISHAGPGKGDHGARLFEQTDKDGDGFVSKAEMQAASEQRFTKADANDDGVLTREEMDAAREKMREESRSRRGDPAERFAKADADGDGKVTLDEMKATATARMAEKGKDGKVPDRHAERMEKFFAAADTNGDGGLTQDEMEAAGDKMKKKHADKRGGKKGDMFSRVDADGDGQVTKAEFVAGGDKMFERLDRNGDGKLEKGEGRPHHGERDGRGAKSPEAE